MDSYQRHKLKEDKFSTAVASSTHWAAENRTTLVVGGVLLVLAVLAVSGFSYRQTNREKEASEQFGKAVQTYTSHVLLGGEKATPGQETYASAKERSIAANKAFDQVAKAYSHTDGGWNALYMSGVTAAEIGDNAKSETQLKQAADHASPDVAALAKLALANLYHATSRDSDAIRLLNELKANPTNSVPESVAGLQLASLYESTDPKKAISLYEEIQKNDKGKDGQAGEGAQLAQERASALNVQEPKK